MADRWATAVEAQARRIRKPHDLRVTVPDQYLQVVALHHVLFAAKLAQRNVPAESAKQIEVALSAFLNATVTRRGLGMTQREALGLSRNVLEHFDEYLCGTGKRQKKDTTKTGLSNEEPARPIPARTRDWRCGHLASRLAAASGNRPGVRGANSSPAARQRTLCHRRCRCAGRSRRCATAWRLRIRGLTFGNRSTSFS